jgi:hypothetical protein
MEQLSKEEILNNQKELVSLAREKGLTPKDWVVIRDSATKAMDAYAKQTAIALIEFIEDGNYKPANNGGYWKATKNGAAIDYCSSEELYELFLQSINK